MALSRHPLSVFPTSHILRTYLITRITSSPILRRASLGLLQQLARPKYALLNVDRNSLLRWIVRHTFYTQFCLGTNKLEVQRTLARFRDIGYSGGILDYALEVAHDESPHKTLAKSQAEAINTWKSGLLRGIDIVGEGDLVSLKWSGVCPQALGLLDAQKPPTLEMAAAMEEVCDAAAEKNTSLLVDAELTVTNSGIEAWCLELQKRYNKRRPVIYTTFQAYLRDSASALSRYLAEAQKHDFILGVKLVRGAYLSSDRRERIWSTQEETDTNYDGIAEALLRRKYTDSLPQHSSAPSSAFPRLAFVIASHNAESIQKAQSIRAQQVKDGDEMIECSFAQLQGMADDISSALIMESKEMQHLSSDNLFKTLKCSCWGSVAQCLYYLCRRASENEDAVARTSRTRIAMANELRRRIGLVKR